MKYLISNHKRAYWYKNLHLEVKLVPLWKFDQPITKAFFGGKGFNYLVL